MRRALKPPPLKPQRSDGWLDVVCSKGRAHVPGPSCHVPMPKVSRVERGRERGGGEREGEREGREWAKDLHSIYKLIHRPFTYFRGGERPWAGHCGLLREHPSFLRLWVKRTHRVAEPVFYSLGARYPKGGRGVESDRRVADKVTSHSNFHK